MSLSDAIAEAQTYIKSPPPNESCTCEWVVLPLLRACGYAPREIYSRIADNNGQFPDYTVLPDTNHTWYLEAKDWNKRLEDSHAQQSLNYANHNGRRFVVLTNGQIWRLYDNAIQGVVGDKMILEARLTDTGEMLSFLGLVEKGVVASGELERRAAKARLRSLLARQLFDPSSDTISAVRNVLRRDAMLHRVRNEEIVSCLRELMASTSEPIALQNASASSLSSTLIVPPTASTPLDTKSSVTATTGLTNLQELADRIRREGYQVVAGTKPNQIIFPDGAHWDGGDWADCVEAIVKWFGENHQLPSLPFVGAERGKNDFLSTKPVHSDNRPMKSVRQIQVKGEAVFVFTNMSANQFVYRLCELCCALEIAPSAVQLKLS